MSNAENIISTLQSRFPAQILEIQEKVARKYYLILDRDIIAEVSKYLKDQGARFVSSVGVDVRELEHGFSVAHIFSLDSEKVFFIIKAYLDAKRPKIKSITPSIAGASWAELEFQDLLGIELIGHPHSKRLVLSEDWPDNTYPLRRDFSYTHKPAPRSTPLVEMKKAEGGKTVIPIGPFFPVLEEPFAIKAFVSGEQILDCDFRGFFNHRGIEKLGDSKLTYNEIPFVAERICGICGFIHSTAYVEAVEEAAGIAVPRRAKYIRTILLELERIHSHLLWLGIAGHIIGFDTVLMQVWRIREPIMWACEKITGNRKTYGQNLIGGVRRDISEEIKPELIALVDKIGTQWQEVFEAIANDSTLHARLKDVGILSTDQAKEFCVVGPTARGSNLPIDARIDHPYSAYDELIPNIVTFDSCDIWARVLVRIYETIESIRLVKEGINKLPEGPIIAEIKEPIPEGNEGVIVVEAPRGEAIHYVITGPDYRPYRWKVRAPTYQQLQALPTMICHETVADLPIILGSMDPCFSCTERLEAVDVKTKKIRVYTNEELCRLSRKKTIAPQEFMMGDKE